jgi:Protein of unknown function (DUF2442)
MKLEVHQENLTAFLSDGREVSIPLSWFTKLGVKSVSPQQLQKYELYEKGDYMVHFPEVDVDLGVEVFTEGLKGICPNCH